MGMFCFCTVYIRCATLTSDRAGLDFGVKTIYHLPGISLLTELRGLILFSRHSSSLRHRSPASGSVFARIRPCPFRAATCPTAVSKDWQLPQGWLSPNPRGPLKLCSLAAGTGKPWSHFPKRSSNQSGLPSYKSTLRDVAGDKEILHVRIFPAPRSLKGGLLFSHSQKALNQPVDYLLCFLIYENTSLHETSARAGRKGEEWITVWLFLRAELRGTVLLALPSSIPACHSAKGGTVGEVWALLLLAFPFQQAKHSLDAALNWALSSLYLLDITPSSYKWLAVILGGRVVLSLVFLFVFMCILTGSRVGKYEGLMSSLFRSQFMTICKIHDLITAFFFFFFFQSQLWC